MLEIILIIAIYAAIQKFLIDAHYKKKIGQAADTEEAIRLRKSLKRARRIGLALFLIGYLALRITLFVVLNEEFTPEAIKSYVTGIGFLIAYLFFNEKKADELSGNVSTMTKDEYLKQNPTFALYLRGFGDDSYAKEKVLKKHIEHGIFSEYRFVELLKEEMQVCAIGMTKELDSPFGATRVYVDDETWKDDVLELMLKASTIYIHVNDRESCLWEIEQAIELVDKTVFIVSNANKYENVRTALIGKLDLPSVPSDACDNNNFFFVKRGDDGLFQVITFENSLEGYGTIIGNEVYNRHCEEEVAAKKQKRKRILWGCVILPIALVVLIFFIVFVVNKCSSHNDQYDDYSLDSVPVSVPVLIDSVELEAAEAYETNDADEVYDMVVMDTLVEEP